MTRALAALRAGLHRSAQNLLADGHREAAQALWAVVEELDDLIIFIANRRR